MLPGYRNSFYVTLDSDPTQEFAENTNAIFKKRLPFSLHLTKPGWKVGMVSLFLPNSGKAPLVETIQKKVVLADLELTEITREGKLVTNAIKIAQK